MDTMTMVINNILAFNTLKDMGAVPYIPVYMKKVVHFFFVVQHDLRHKAHLVAGGNLTEPPMESAYSSVVNLRSLRTCLVATKRNGVDIMVGDISSVYPEADTKEKVCFTAGPEFGALAGKTLIIEKALLFFVHPEPVSINILHIPSEISGTSHVSPTMVSGGRTVEHTTPTYVFTSMTSCTCQRLISCSSTPSKTPTNTTWLVLVNHPTI
jgi:hypothetical protein